jgi:hypothetical protein
VGREGVSWCEDAKWGVKVYSGVLTCEIRCEDVNWGPKVRPSLGM